MAAPRNASTTGPSIYDRILVMATSSAPAPAVNAARPSPSAQANPFNGTQRFVPPSRGQRPEQPEQEEIAEQDENQPQPPVFTFPQPGQQPGTFTNAPGVAQPGMVVPAPQTITINPAQQAPGQPTMPIGVPQPGMMVPAPQPNTPNQPGMIRPPGIK
jgi:hypothetical protein